MKIEESASSTVSISTPTPATCAPRRCARRRASPSANTALDEAEFVTYGHIVVDEAQDLSPMELRVLKRRDLTGSMTIVGDMGQATTVSSRRRGTRYSRCSILAGAPRGWT